MSNALIIEKLSQKYDQLQDDIESLTEELKAEFRAEKARRKLELEKAFAVEFEFARQSGIKRYELCLPVLKTNNGDRYKHFVELGGGELTRLRNADERAEERAQEAVANLQAQGVTDIDAQAQQVTISRGLNGDLSRPYRVEFFSTRGVFNRQFPKVRPVNSEEARDFTRDAGITSQEDRTTLATRLLDVLGWTLTP